MSSKVHCYLRTLRNEWGLTQKELASLLPKGDRNRVSFVERGIIPPNAGEILAYSLIFGLSGQAIFRRLSSETDEAVMQGAYRLYRSLERKFSEVMTSAGGRSHGAQKPIGPLGWCRVGRSGEKLYRAALVARVSSPASASADRRRSRRDRWGPSWRTSRTASCARALSRPGGPRW